MAAIDKWIADVRAKFPAQPSPKAAARPVPVATLNADGTVTVRTAQGVERVVTPRMVNGEVEFTYTSKGKTYPLRGNQAEAAKAALPPGWSNPEEASGPEPTPAEQAPASESTRRIDEARSLDGSPSPVVESLQDAAEGGSSPTADALEDAAESLRRSDQSRSSAAESTRRSDQNRSDQIPPRPRPPRNPFPSPSPSRNPFPSPSPFRNPLPSPRPPRNPFPSPRPPRRPRPRPRPRPSRNPRGSSPRGRTPDQHPIRPKPGTRREARPVIILWRVLSSSGRRRTSSPPPGTAPPGRDS
jgi:hypothetical protein